MNPLPSDQLMKNFVADGIGASFRLTDETQAALPREELLSSARQGKIASLTVEATVANTRPNANHFKFRPEEFEAFAKSFEKRPFLRDHEAKQEARGGTILQSWAEGDGAGGFTMKQHIRATKDWAILGLLDETMDRFSIGWSADALCTVCNEEMGIFHEHAPGYRYDDKGKRTKEKTGTLCEAVMVEPKGKETSAVVIPACDGTGVVVGLSDGVQAIYSLSELFARPEVKGREGENMDKVRQVFGLAADADESAIVAAAQKLSDRQAEQAATLSRITEKLGLAAGTDESGILAALTQLGSPANTVPMAEYKAKLEEIRKMNADHRVELLTRDGVLSPAEREYAVGQCLADEANFENWAATKPKSVPIGGTPPPRLPTRDPKKLTDDEKKICQSFGTTENDYIEQKEADRALVAGR